MQAHSQIINAACEKPMGQTDIHYTILLLCYIIIICMSFVMCMCSILYIFHRAITCHLQTSGYTVVLGSNKDAVNKVRSYCC